MLERIQDFLQTTGIYRLFEHAANDTTGVWWQTLIMFVIAFTLVYLAIVKKFEPLLLLPIAIGMLLTNLPGANMFNLNFFIPPEETVTNLTNLINNACADMILTIDEYRVLLANGVEVAELFPQFAAGNVMPTVITEETKQALLETVTAVDYGAVLHDGGLLDLLYLGVKLGIYPCLIFIGIGAMTDFSPLISNPKSLLIGAGAQLGVFVAFFGAFVSGVFTLAESAHKQNAKRLNFWDRNETRYNPNAMTAKPIYDIEK